MVLIRVLTFCLDTRRWSVVEEDISSDEGFILSIASDRTLSCSITSSFPFKLKFDSDFDIDPTPAAASSEAFTKKGEIFAICRYWPNMNSKVCKLWFVSLKAFARPKLRA